MEKSDKVRCPYCGSDNATKDGRTASGKQIFCCKNVECTHHNFINEYTNKGVLPKIRKKVLEMESDGIGVRATGRILGISRNTIASIRKTGR